MSREIIITAKDHDLLLKLINKEREFGSDKNKESLKTLEFELKRARIVPSDKIPPDSITMNSKVLLKELASGEETIYTLVYPDDADLIENKISVLAPIGTAMLGFRKGDIIDWEVPAGTIKLKVEDIVYQPEAAGDYHL